MKVIILCAGFGRRININKPKCLIKINGKALIDITLKLLKKNKIKQNQIYLALGYQYKKILKHTKKKYKYSLIRNFKKTNMVYSLYNCLKNNFNDDIVILYGDIMYSDEIIYKIIKAKNKITTAVDINWRKAWELTDRMEDDLETLKIKQKKIINIGKKTKKLDDIDGRYIGATKFNKEVVNFFIKFYEKKIKNKNRKFLKLDMNSLLMKLINVGFLLNYVKIRGLWFEFDNKNDINIYKKKFNK